MQTNQFRWHNGNGWQPEGKNQTLPAATMGSTTQLLLLFGDRDLLQESDRYDELRSKWPDATIVVATTAGEILGSAVSGESIVATLITFESTTIRTVCHGNRGLERSWGTGFKLASGLEQNGLGHVLVFSDGANVNGSELIRGMREALPQTVAITGGMAGDRGRFEQTLVGLNAPPKRNQVVAVGLYGERLRVGYGSGGGWEANGPRWIVTRSKGNIVYELDGRPALELYRTHLGDEAANLPASALLFPLNIREPEADHGLVRTILSVDPEESAMIFAGDVPQGSYAQMMSADLDRLVAGAEDAARQSGLHDDAPSSPQLALLVSCVGRRLVMADNVSREIEGVRGVFGEDTAVTGFYSYGEISTSSTSHLTELHNQTMTITTMSEE